MSRIFVLKISSIGGSVDDEISLLMQVIIVNYSIDVNVGLDTSLLRRH